MPAPKAAATLLPLRLTVRRPSVDVAAADGIETFTPGAARSGLTRPSLV